MCDIKYSSKTAFYYLEDIKTNFLDKFNMNAINNAISYSLNTGFVEILKNKMEYYNKNIDAGDSISILKKEVLEAHENIMNASDLISTRGNKINLIVKKAETLRTESNSYFENAKKIRKEIRNKRIKLILILIGFILFFGYFLSVILCGGYSYEGCRSE